MDIRHYGHIAAHHKRFDLTSNRGFINIFIGGIFFGTVGLFTIPMAQLGLDPMTTAFIRLGFGSLVLAIAIVATKGISAFKVSARTLIVCMILGVLFHGLHNLCYLVAIVESGVTTSAVLVRVAPIVTAFLSAVLFKETITKRKGIALALNVVGCVMAVFSVDMFTGGGNLIGILCGIGAGITYGYLPVIMGFIKEEVDPLVVNAYGFFFGTVFMLFASKPWEHTDLFTLPALGIGALFGLIPTGIGYCIYYKGVSTVTEQSKIPVVVSIELVVATIIGIALFGDSITPLNVAGFLLLFASIFMISKE